MKEYIEREAVIKYLAKCADGYSYIETPTESAIANIKRWKDKNGNDVLLDDCGCSKASVWCSECGDWLTASDEYLTRGRYCPNCGAKMDGGADK